MDNFMKCLLHQNIEVKHICISTNKHTFSNNAYPSQLKIEVDNHYINTDITPIKALKELFSKGSYNINRFYCDGLANKISKELVQENYDCIILESLFTTKYIETMRSISDVPIFLRTHNIEHKITSDLAKNASGLKKIYLNKLAKDLKSYEIETLKTVDGILSISKDDTAQIKELAISTSIKTISVSVNCPKVVNKYNSEGIFHLGSMNWEPNLEAVDRLIKLFPQIKNAIPSCKLHIAGSASDAHNLMQQEKGIYYDGFVNDINEYASDKGILVSPIISGSGIRIKILEMMAIGIPVITTELGASGVNYVNGKELIIANSDEELTKASIDLIKNKKKRQELGENGIHYIRKNHNIESISKEILEFIERT